MLQRVHPDILASLSDRILPHVIGIQDFDTPCPAQLWLDDTCIHHEGVAMFNVGERGYLTAEYFGYDNAEFSHAGFMLPESRARLVLEDTNRIVPIWDVQPSRKAATKYSRLKLPLIKAYELDIHGWLGDPAESPVRSASISLTGLPDLNLPKSSWPAPEEDRDLFTMQGITSRNAVIRLEAGCWNIKLSEFRGIGTEEPSRSYHAFLTRTDRSPFNLSGSDSEDSILDALYRFLSFQFGKWVTVSSIVCAPEDRQDWVVRRAFAGRLVPPPTKPGNDWIASDWRTWPLLFAEFWRQYTGPGSREHLKHAVHHYVESESIFNESAVDYALVAAQSTLQALVRWWNDLETGHRFGSRKPTFRELLIDAVNKAELGKDQGMTLNTAELKDVSKRATRLRNNIDHGRGGNVTEHAESVIAFGRYYHDLARFLLLAKLGYRGRDARGSFFSPSFVRRTDSPCDAPDVTPNFRE